MMMGLLLRSSGMVIPIQGKKRILLPRIL